MAFPFRAPHGAPLFPLVRFPSAAAVSRGLRGLALALGATTALLTAAVHAASQTADAIALTSAQVQAIGIRLLELAEPAAAAGVAYPARAVLPRGREQIVSAAVSGSVDRVLVEDHAAVRAGQVLVALNSPEFGEWQLKLLEATQRERVAAATLARERALFDEGIVPERRVLEARAESASAIAAAQQARAALRLAGADAATITRIAAGEVQERLLLRAPRDATVLSIAAKPGQRVAGADPLLTLGELGRLWLDVELPAASADAWDPAARLTVVGRSVAARPLSVAAQVSGSQTVTLRAEVVEGAERLRPGEALQVRVPQRHDGPAWRVPNAALVRHEGRSVVFVRTSAGFVARDVVVVDADSDGATVSGALSASDRIAVAGTVALKAAWLGASGAEDE